MVRVVAVLVGLSLGVLGAEGLLRLVWTPPALSSVPFQTTHPLYGSALIPGAAGSNATAEYRHEFHVSPQGLRGDAVFAAERPADVDARVLFLGDSFTFGLGSSDDETFVARLDRAWPDVEVANTGANGYGTREELAFLDHFGAAFRPDLAVLVFFWNDLEDIVEHDALRFDVGPDDRVRRIAPEYDDDPLELHPAPELSPARSVGSYLRWFLKNELRGLRYRYFGIRPRPIRTEEQKQRAWSLFRELLELTRRRAEELGTALVVAAIPDHNQVDESAVIKNIGPLNFDVQDRLARICAELDLPFIDLLPGLKREFERTGARLYYYADRHLTPEGNRVVAELLEPRLRAFLE